MEPQNVDPREFLEVVRADREGVVWAPLDPVEQQEGGLGARRVAEDESLEYLHKHWVLPHAPDAAMRRGLVGRVLRLFAKLTFRVLQPYLLEERELLSNMVRVHDETAKRVDEIVDDLYRRRILEAKNLAELAAWLHAGPLGGSDEPATR